MNEMRIIYTVFDEDGLKSRAFENEADAKIYAFDLAFEALMEDSNTTIGDIKETWREILDHGSTDWGPFIEAIEIATDWRDAING